MFFPAFLQAAKVHLEAVAFELNLEEQDKVWLLFHECFLLGRNKKSWNKYTNAKKNLQKYNIGNQSFIIINRITVKFLMILAMKCLDPKFVNFKDFKRHTQEA